jgi:TP901 family phage tail tape measure protein
MADTSVVGALRVLLTADSAQFEATMKSASATLGRLSKDFGRMGTQLQSVGTTLTKAITLPLVGIATASAKTAIDFESSFAGISKTVDGVSDKFGTLTEFGRALAQGMRDLAKTIPVNVNELNNIGQAAGQLGIKKENILGFTKVIAELGVTTNLSSDEAATSLARLANITQMPQENFDRLGSTIVALGNNFATTESEITDFGLRIAGAGKLAGLSEDQILAIGAAMSSVGVEAEAGGTAVQKVLNDMTAAVATGGKELDQFAKTAGMSAEQFRVAFRKDAAGAFTEFVSGLQREGDGAFQTLDNLKLGNERVVRAFLSLANAGDLLTRTLKVAGDGWRENTALTEEAQRRFATTQSQLTLLWNRIKDVGITIGNALLPGVKALIGGLDGLLPVVEAIAKVFTTLPGWVQGIAIGFVGLAAAIGPVTFAFGKLLEGASTLLGLFGKKSAVLKGLTAAYEGVGKASAALGGLWGVTVLAATVALANEIDNLSKQTEESTDAFKRGEVSGQNFADAIGNAFARGTNPIRAFIHDLRQAWHDWNNVVEIILGTPIRFPEVKAPKLPTTEALPVPGIPRDLPQIYAELAVSTDTATTSQKGLKDAAEAAAKAQREANAAAADYVASLDALDAAAERAGVMTQSGYGKKLAELTESLEAAAKQGPVALAEALKNLAVEADTLAARAKASGLDASIATGLWTQYAQTINAATGGLAGFEAALPLRPIGDLTDGLQKVTIEQELQWAETQRLTDAYKAFGLETPQALQKAADAAARNYQVLRDSGTATTQQLRDAFEQMVKAQREASGQLPSYWESDVLPRLKNVVDTISGSMSDAFGRMLVGAQGFKDGFVDVWHNIQRSIADVLSSILDDFIGRFLKGLLGAMTGAKGGFAGAFAGMFGGGGGFGIPGLGGPGNILTNGGGIFGGMLGGGGFAAPVGANVAPGSMFAGMPGGAAGIGMSGILGGVGAGGAGLGLGMLFQKWLGGAGAGAAVGGGLSGAGAGALIGSIVPGIGTAIGALIGGLSGVFGGLFGDTKNMKANNSRDAFTSQFGGTGTGAGSGFMNLAAKLTEATGEAGGGSLFKAFLDAHDPEAVAKAIENINAALDAYAQKSAAAAANEQQQATAIAQTTAELKAKTDAIHEQMQGLDDELAKLNASEAPEKHMGTVEKRTRERIAREKADLQAQLDAAQKAAAEAIEAIKAAGTGANDTLKTEGQTTIDGLKDGWLDLKTFSQEQLDAIRAMLAGLGKNLPPIHIPVTVDLPDGVDSPGHMPDRKTPDDFPVAAHALGGVFSNEHLARIAEGGEPEIVGPVGFMAKALEGALARVGGLSPGGPLQSVTILEMDKREVGRAIADVLPGELRRLGVRVRT